jgi:type II secretory pathway component PulK
MEEDPAAELVDALVDWVDEDDLEEPQGAEYEDYEEMGYTNRPFNRPFYSLDEMNQVRGMALLRRSTRTGRTTSRSGATGGSI